MKNGIRGRTGMFCVNKPSSQALYDQMSVAKWKTNKRVKKRTDKEMERFTKETNLSNGRFL
jgi:hypothetical protein